MRKKLVISVIIAVLGLSISLAGAYLEPREEEASLGPRLYNQAVAAYEEGRYVDAYKLFFEAGIHTDDEALSAKITYNMATLMLQARAPAEQIIMLYQDSIRMHPTEEASFNLEWLYNRLREIEVEGGGRPGKGDNEGKGTYGDI